MKLSKMSRYAGVAAVAALTGCMSVVPYERGPTVPVAKLEERRADLPALVEELIASGESDLAFYAFEILRTRPVVADRLTMESRPVPAPFHKMEGFLTGGGAQLLNAADPRNQALRAAAAPSDDLFFEELSVVERRMRAYASMGDAAYKLPFSALFADRYVVATTTDLRLALAPGEAMLGYFLGKEKGYAFVGTNEGVEVVDLGPAAPIRSAAKELRAAIEDKEREVASARGAKLAVVATGAPRGRADWVKAAQALDKALIAPVQERLEEAEVEALFLVPHAELANVPFQALLGGKDGKTTLVERYRLTYQPSFSVYTQTLSRDRSKDAPKVLAVGLRRPPQDPDFLPLAAKEAETVGAIFPGSAAWADGKATEGRFRQEYKSFNIFHFATHGYLSAATPLAHTLLLDMDRPKSEVLAMAPETLGQGPIGDGCLTAAEVRMLDLGHAYLAVLSACHSAESGGSAGEAEVASLAGAFIVAGAPTAVGSLWPAEDTSTTELFLLFYESFLELGASEAMRQAQLAIRSREEFSHPFFWANFNVYGLDK